MYAAFAYIVHTDMAICEQRTGNDVDRSDHGARMRQFTGETEYNQESFSHASRPLGPEIDPKSVGIQRNGI